MDVLVERCAGLDVHRDTVVATVRVPPDRGGANAGRSTPGPSPRPRRGSPRWVTGWPSTG